MQPPLVPQPGAMPVDRQTWARQLHVSNFINAYYQYRDIQVCEGVRTVLVIGPGQGFDTAVLRWRGYNVTTFDIDEAFNPDQLGSVHDMNMFKDRQFDAAIASHVLEHLAVPYLDRSLQEIARVSKYALTYFPVAGRHFQVRVKADLKGWDRSWLFDLFNYFHAPDGVTPKYCQKQHFWELGMRGFRRRDIARRISKWFEIIRQYRNPDWYYSYNFVLKSKSGV